MKKKYYLSRIIRSLVSIVAIMIVVFTMVYSLVPRDNIFFNDTTFVKLAGKPDDKLDYQMRTWQKVGYLEYETLANYCGSLYETGSDKVTACLLTDSKESKDFVQIYEEKGYEIGYLPVSKRPYASIEKPILTRLFKWFSNILVIDHPGKIQDAKNPNLERNISVGTTISGGLAVKCSGCEHKYLLYTDTRFPFIHQNIITLDLGTSYPSYNGLKVLDVIFNTQGAEDKRSVVYETGLPGETGMIFGTLKYKSTLDKLEKNKFVDNYADGIVKKNTPSMVGVSFIMGIFAMVLAYGIGLPVGVLMAKNKDGIIDKLGMLYIIFIIAVPSLAYIYVFRFLGTTIFGLPSTFPTLGPSDIRSWVLPTISLALPSISSLMLWTRRFIVDQMNSDYVKFAKAKGMNENEIFWKHIFRNAIIPIAQGIPSSLASCITGAIITESIYSVGGMGKMLPDAINGYNNAVIIALTFIYSAVSIISTFLGDIVVTWVDPRISLEEKEGRA